MSLLIKGATIIDGVTDVAIKGRSIWIAEGRIRAIGSDDELCALTATEVIDARGKYVIPGLMDANVHLFSPMNLESVARHFDCLEDVILEAAQVALKSGITTVFDTWGPRRHLIAVRDRINSGKAPGSRIFCAGNIVGLDGPFSPDFSAKAHEMATPAFVKRVNSIWVENVGRHLMWLTPDLVAGEVRAYLSKGIDFLKYASNEHYPGAFLAFSPEVQSKIVEEAHRAGVTAQAHTMSVEGLRLAVEAGCDLIQHANITGPVPIAEATLELMARQNTSAVVFPHTQGYLDLFMQKADPVARCVFAASDTNVRNLIRSGVKLLMAWDANVQAPDASTDPLWGWTFLSQENPSILGEGHFVWLKSMEEKGCPSMPILRAATTNIAAAYGVDDMLGTIELGKIADLLILDRDPLIAAENYRSIHCVIKDGVVVNRESLPTNPILTRPIEPASEEASYVPFLGAVNPRICPACMRP